MSDSQITLKHNKHCIHPCSKDKKLSLLKVLLAQYSAQDIVVAISEEAEALREALADDGVRIFSDKELLKLPELRCELLISYDLSSSAIFYIARVAKVNDGAIALFDDEEQAQLYAIETLLGRAIRQEVVAGFESEDKKMKIAPKISEKPKKSFDKPKYEKPKRDGDKPRYDKEKKDGEKSSYKPFDKPKYDKPKRDGEKPKYDKPKRDGDKPKYDKEKRDGEKSSYKPFDKPKRDDKTGKKPNKFLGKDESGKAKFSGKSGERNHRYDGTPKVEVPKKEGRKIPIKERKPKED